MLLCGVTKKKHNLEANHEDHVRNFQTVKSLKTSVLCELIAIQIHDMQILFYRHPAEK